jgi:hypothetical protein
MIAFQVDAHEPSPLPLTLAQHGGHAMTSPHLPTPREAKQLCRLRALRVQRARERCGQAQAGVEAATQAVRERQRRIEQLQVDLAALGRAVVNELAPALPRWGTLAGARRANLAERLERDEYELIGDEHKLEQAREALQQARAELTRALARQDAVQGVADETRRARGAALERRSEVDIEDQRAGSAALRERAA